MNHRKGGFAPVILAVIAFAFCAPAYGCLVTATGCAAMVAP